MYVEQFENDVLMISISWAALQFSSEKQKSFPANKLFDMGAGAGLVVENYGFKPLFVMMSFLALVTLVGMTWKVNDNRALLSEKR